MRAHILLKFSPFLPNVLFWFQNSIWDSISHTVVMSWGSQSFLLSDDLDSFEESGQLFYRLFLLVFVLFFFFFLWTDWSYRFWRGRPERQNVIFHHILWRIHITVDLSLGHLAEIVFARFLHSRVTLFPAFPHGTLCRELHAEPTPKEWGIHTHSP